MDAFVDFAPESWGLRPETSLGPPTGGKLPMGLSVGPRAGGNVLITGDASGAINPFNGEGIAYGYETGRLAAAALGHALERRGRPGADRLRPRAGSRLGPYYKVARAFVHLISNPEAMRLCVGLGHALGAAHDPAAAHHGQPDAPRRRRPGRARLPRHGARVARSCPTPRARDSGCRAAVAWVAVGWAAVAWAGRRLGRPGLGGRRLRHTSQANRRSSPLATRSNHARSVSFEPLGDARRGDDAHPSVEGDAVEAPPDLTLAADDAHELPDRPGRTLPPQDQRARQIGRRRSRRRGSQSMITQPSGPTNTLEGCKS